MKKKGSVLDHILHADVVRDENMTADYDVATIGAGAAGIAAAFRRLREYVFGHLSDASLWSWTGCILRQIEVDCLQMKQF